MAWQVNNGCVTWSFTGTTSLSLMGSSVFAEHEAQGRESTVLSRVEAVGSGVTGSPGLRHRNASVSYRPHSLGHLWQIALPPLVWFDHFARAAITKYHECGLNNRNLLFHGLGGWNSGIKVSAGLVPSEGCEGRVYFRPLSLACRWLFSPCVFSSLFVHVQIFLS